MEIEKLLDDYLNFVNENGGFVLGLNAPNYKTTADLQKSISIINKEDFEELSSILEDDKYIEYQLQSQLRELNNLELDSIIRIKITIRGKRFLDQGGYVGKLERMNQEKNRVRILESKSEEMQKSTLILTFVLAFAATIASVWYGIEIYKFWYSYFHR